MSALTLPLNFLHRLNELLLRLGRWLGVLAMAVMVGAILIQVFFRYFLNNALPWPDEAARFCMLWLTGLMAPSAFRQGGFVAIDMVRQSLPEWPARVLNLFLLLCSLAILLVALRIGWGEITGFSGRFATASLYVPTQWDFSQFMRVPRSWMMASLVCGLGLLLLVNIELILRQLSGRALPTEPD